MEPEKRIVIVSGTGTEVGKTHVAAALLVAWGHARRVLGYKPIETGVPRAPAETGEDARRLARASTFHVKHPVFHLTFLDPVSPHLAARREGTRIDLEKVARQALELARGVDRLVVELAGGLFTPVGPGKVNADLARRLSPSRLLVVAPDRLGVLHDVGATLRAAEGMGLRVDGVVLSAPAVADVSTGTNAEELRRALGVRVLAVFPRAPPRARATGKAAEGLAQALQRARKSVVRT